MTRAAEVTSGQVSARAPDGSLLTGKGVGIAIVDTGIDGTHPDLEYGTITKRNLKMTYDGAVELYDTDTTSGHGTAVAGIAAGRGYLPEFAGTAPGATIYGLGAGEIVSVFWTLQSFDWILTHHDKVDPPIKVVVNAWGSPTNQYQPGSPTSWYVQTMVDRGMTVVFAAGNAGGDGSSDTTSAECNIPVEGSICVGAYRDHGRTTPTGSTAPFSSRGDAARPATWPDLVAPGDRITSTLALTGTMAATGVWMESPSTLYTTLSGTSMAAPMVGAAAAILYQYDPSITPAEIEAALEASAVAYDGKTGSTSLDPRFAGSTFDRGHGLLDVQAAVQFVGSGGTSTIDGSGGTGSGGGTTGGLTGEGGLIDETLDTITETIDGLV